MKKTSSILIFLLAVLVASSQTPTPTSILAELVLLNNEIKNDNCDGKRGMIISNRALNSFFAGKIASYLSEGGDLSLFKNYATLNSSDGQLSINSNICVKKNVDGRIKWLTTVGAKANIADGFAAIFEGKDFSNELGITIKQTLMGKGTTFFDGCSQKQKRGVNPPPLIPSAQKQKMDAERSFILHSIEIEMNQKAADFEASLTQMVSVEIPNQTLATVRNELRDKFYTQLRDEYLEKFAEMQVEALENTASYNSVKTHWTSVSAYIPVTTKKYNVATSYNINFSEKQIYPWKFSVSHNGIRESEKWGRFFFNITGELIGNNNIKTDELEKISLNDYKDLGSSDPLKYAEIKTEEVYIGHYNSFITPFLKGQVVWFPKKWNVGFSISLEQNFGEYNPLNGKLGFPIRLNDSEGNATVNFEIQVRSFDMTHKIDSEKKLGEKTAIGISVGLPFSSIIY